MVGDMRWLHPFSCYRLDSYMTSHVRVAYRFLTALSGTFDLKEFKKIPVGHDHFDLDRFSRLEKYLRDHAKYIDEGHTRKVYDIGEGRVLKLALPGWQSANLAEIHSSNCMESGPIAKVLDYDPEGTWLIMEEVETLSSPSEFRNLVKKSLGLPEKFPNIHLDPKILLGLFIDPQGTSSKLNVWLQSHPSPWLDSMRAAVKTCGLEADDLYWFNFGVKNGNLVILDYGG